MPYSGISGSTPVSGSPKLIATCYALHRPLTPRNPPQALKRLIKIYFLSYFKLYSIVKEHFAYKANTKFCIRTLLKIQSRDDTVFRTPIAALFIIIYEIGGGDRDRTYDLLRARQALSRLSYTPKNGISGSHFKKKVVGLDRFELSTSRLSGVRSNQLSYRPI